MVLFAVPGAFTPGCSQVLLTIGPKSSEFLATTLSCIKLYFIRNNSESSKLRDQWLKYQLDDTCTCHM